VAVKLAPIWVGQQFFTSAGNVLNGGKINTYLAGTTTPQSTFTDSTGITPNANPIVLDSSGRYSSQIWLTAGVNYKFVLTDSASNILLTEDNLTGVNDTSAAGVSEWITGTTATYISATSFSVAGNQTSVYQVGMRVKSTINAGSVYSTIATSAFGAVTTVTLVNDSSSLDATLSAVAYSILGETNPSIPANISYAINLTGGGKNVDVHKVKAANTDRANNIVMSNDPDLVYSIPIAGTYSIEVFVPFSCVGGTVGPNTNLNFSGTITIGSIYELDTFNASGPSHGGTQIASAVSTVLFGLSPTTNTSTPTDHILWKASLVAATTGTLGVAWCQASSAATATRFGQGAYMRVTQIS
jgi:hypothetical protein